MRSDHVTTLFKQRVVDHTEGPPAQLMSSVKQEGEERDQATALVTTVSLDSLNKLPNFKSG